jgi:hypothetical protein
VVSKQDERTTFKHEAKMTDSMISSQKFPVKSGITGFSRRKFAGKESQRLPIAMKALLKNTTNMSVGGISCQRQICLRIRMVQGNGRGKERLGSRERGMHGRRPGEEASFGSGICQGFEDFGNAWQESPVKVQHTEKLLQGFDIRGRRKVNDGRDMGGHGRKT